MENFDFKLEPGRFREKNLSINDGKPLISIITAYYNSKEYIMQTANSVFNQTFPYWEWIIVNDGSTEEGTKEILEELAKKDKRIKVYYQENQGRLVARDIAISKTTTDIIYMLDSDDILDKTLFECGYWTLFTNPDATWAYCNCVTFGGEEFLYKPYFNSEREKKENLLIGSCFIRKDKLLEIGGYNVVHKDVHEDWHLWLRMLEKGYFPIKMNYYGFWYRRRKGSVLHTINTNKKKDKLANKVIKEQAKKIEHYVQAIQYPVSTGYNSFNTYPKTFAWDRNQINVKGEKKRLLFIFPWFTVGGADKFNYDLISRLDKDKYDITIITTEPTDYIWRQKFEQVSNEVYDLTTFLHRQNWASFIHYIIKSRNIDFVMQSNSYYGYYVLPWLKAEFPEVIFTDYIHAHDWSWRAGGYPRESVAISRLLDKTYTCNNYVQTIMTDYMGRTHNNIQTVYIGVDTEEFSEEKVNFNNYSELEKLKDKKVILFPCRIVELKRPIFILEVLKEICQKRDDVVLLVVGDGEQLGDMKDFSKKLGLENNVIFTGMQDDVKPCYKAADVTVICSLTEGLALTAYESLAMSVPVITSDVGGQAELVDSSCGKVIPLKQSVEKDLFNRDYDKKEIQDYVDAILEIFENKNYEQIKKNCRKKIVEKFSVEKMVKDMDKSISSLIEIGTNVDIRLLNKEIYEQYLVMYNEIDKRDYNISKGGIVDKNIEIGSSSYQATRLKSILWKNPLYRIFINFLQRIGVIRFIKNIKYDKGR